MSEKVSEHYDDDYFDWQAEAGEFGGWANQTKFVDLLCGLRLRLRWWIFAEESRLQETIRCRNQSISSGYCERMVLKSLIL